ncbi:glycoside hydrolase family protein [Bacillus sp. FSL K6-3431]|uniref:glycoside hydrolase family protein n=1 Tax=Bacillus sp. FSL K6-3431 TaxID=2921500 RepID=UPI0030F91E95
MIISNTLYERILPAPKDGGFRMEDYWIWCGSVIEGEDGRYHMFASRWPKYLPMHPGWLVACEVVRAVSDKPEGPYDFQEVVLSARGAQYWDGRSTHNPHITKYEDTYLLYYMGSTHPFEDVKPNEAFNLQDPRTIVARSNKRIGLATSKSINGPWVRSDDPILQTRPGKFDSFLVSNPAPCVNEDGSVLLIYKARTYVGNYHSDMMIGVAKAENPFGPYVPITDEPIFSSADVHIEDPFIWKSEKGYEMIAKDMKGNLCGERHAGIHAVSVDGVCWEILPGVKSYSRKIKWDDGKIQTMGSLERPFILFKEGHPRYLFAATADGTGGFSKATKTWNMVIPLKN